MDGKALIGLNADYRTATKDMPAFTYVAAQYYDAIREVGGVPVIIPPMEDVGDIERVLDVVDGVMLIGGADLDPRADGFMLHHTVRPMAKRRETFDRKLAKLIARRRIPVFGIGSGMQLLNVTQGGNLFLNIADDLPHALPHRDPIDSGHRHTLEIAPDSIMDRVFGDGEIRVNSMHHMAIDELAPCFRITARCPDGVIEAIESVDPEEWFVVATQFHPEADSASALDIRIFEEFVTGVRGEVVTAARLVA